MINDIKHFGKYIGTRRSIARTYIHNFTCPFCGAENTHEHTKKWVDKVECKYCHKEIELDV